MQLARVTAASAMGLLVLAAVISGCSSTRHLDSGDVQDEIARGLVQQAGGEYEVVCPTGIPAQTGYAFTCTVTTLPGGESATVTVTQTDDQGAFTWKVEGTDS